MVVRWWIVAFLRCISPTADKDMYFICVSCTIRSPLKHKTRMPPRQDNPTIKEQDYSW